MKRSLLLAAAAIVCLAACGKETEGPVDSTAGEVASAPATSAMADHKSPATPALPQLTYRYSYGLEAPSDRLRGLVEQHESACADAGLEVCQILSQDIHAAGRDRLQAELRLRATPQWLHDFRGRIADQVKAVGGTVAASNVSTDDLTRPIFDADARLKSATATRDRLQQLIASKAGTLAELKDMRANLDATQSELEAAKAQLDQLRAQVQMYELRITYAPPGVLTPQGAWAPVGEAAAESGAAIAVTLAFLLRLLIWTGPTAALVALAYAAWRALARKAPKPAA